MFKPCGCAASTRRALLHLKSTGRGPRRMECARLSHASNVRRAVPSRTGIADPRLIRPCTRRLPTRVDAGVRRVGHLEPPASARSVLCLRHACLPWWLSWPCVGPSRRARRARRACDSSFSRGVVPPSARAFGRSSRARGGGGSAIAGAQRERDSRAPACSH